MLETLKQVCTQEPVPPSRLQPTVPRDLESICLKCLEKEPVKRYAGCEELGRDLRRYLRNEPVLARPVSRGERLWRWCRRNPWIAALAGSLVLSVVIGAIVAVCLAVEARSRAAVATEEKTRADREAARAKDESFKARSQAAGQALDKGLLLCERGDVGQGILWLARSLEMAPADAPTLQFVVRMNLAAWRRQLVPLKALVVNRAPELSGFQFPVLDPKGASFLMCEGRQARLRSMTTGEAFGLPLLHESEVITAAFSPDGSLVATGAMDGTIQLWNSSTGKPMGAPIHSSQPVYFVALSRDRRTILATDGDNTARLWDGLTGKPVGEALQLPLYMSEWVFGPDGKTVLGRSLAERNGRILGRRPQASPSARAFSMRGQQRLSGHSARTGEPC
jgi:hypothetical protein